MGLIEKMARPLGLDLVIADHIMCITSADMKDPEAGQTTAMGSYRGPSGPFGQIWIITPVIDETTTMADKTREWRWTPWAPRRRV